MASTKGGKPLYFWGHGANNQYAWMSQWFMSDFTVDGVTFNCCEQWMMWNKAKLFGDDKTAAEILAANNPKRQKALGRGVANFDGDKWDKEKSRIVEDGNYHKFLQGHDAQSDKALKQLLLDTGERELVEASPTDRIWGIGYKATDADKVGREKWGENLLGKALVAARKRLREEA